MLTALVYGAALLGLTVVVHMTGMVAIFRWVLPRLDVGNRFWPVTWLLIRIAWALIAVHLLEIAVWALFYWSQGCFQGVEAAVYFSGVTYSTVGYGDVVLPEHWRLLGPIEGLTGILMCGLSTGLFFAVISKLYATEPQLPLR
jgi:Ion channel